MPPTRTAPTPAAKAGPLAPETRERIIASRAMVLLIAPLFLVILLTLKPDAPRQLERLAPRLGLSPGTLLPTARVAYHVLIGLACAIPPLYAALGLVRLLLGRGSPRSIMAVLALLALGLAEAASIAAAVYRYKVAF